MTKDEALKLALMALEHIVANSFYQYAHQQVMRQPDNFINKAITDIKEALAQLEQKYHRGDRLICLETEEYCIIHISGTDRQWVKFPDSHIGVYTNEQVAELFELLPKETDQEPMAWMDKHGDVLSASVVNGKGLRNIPLYTTPTQRAWVGLTQTQVKLLWEGVQEEAVKSGDSLNWVFYTHINEALKEKNNAPKRIQR